MTEKALEYYYKNREKILEKNKLNKLNKNSYYREWYFKNKVEVQNRRRGDNPKKKRGLKPKE